MNVIDSHTHFGEGYESDDYLEQIREISLEGKPAFSKNTKETAVITGAITFPLADDIYPRIDDSFRDNVKWQEKREKANQYCLGLVKKVKDIEVYPFKFAWSDFNLKNIRKYCGAKWQRREHDPEYEMGSDNFLRFMDILRKRKMPIVFEDEAENILSFLKKYAEGINVIIPHLGFGGRNYEALERGGVWNMENVFSDTSYASDTSLEVIKEHIGKYGHKRIFFGSDFPLVSDPNEELRNILSLNVSREVIEDIVYNNIMRLLDRKK